MYRSKGIYDIPVTRDDLNKIIEVMHVLIPGKGDDKVVQLKWIVADILKQT